MTAGGRLDRRVTIRRRVPTRGADGSTRKGFDDLAEVWAMRRDVSDGERFEAGVVAAQRMTRWTVRASVTDLVGGSILPTDLIRYGDEDHEILGVKETAHGRNRFLEITTTLLVDGAT